MCQGIFVFLFVNDENVLVLLWCHLPLGRRRARTTLGGMRLRSTGLPSQSRKMFLVR